MATVTSVPVDVTAGTATITANVDTVSPGANRRVIALKVGPNKVRFVGYDIA